MGSTIVSLVQDVAVLEASYMGDMGCMRTPLSTLFCSESKTPLENKVYFLKNALF